MLERALLAIPTPILASEVSVDGARQNPSQSCSGVTFTAAQFVGKTSVCSRTTKKSSPARQAMLLSRLRKFVTSRSAAMQYSSAPFELELTQTPNPSFKRTCLRHAA